MTEQEKATQFAQKAPPLNQTERYRINALFPAYLFRRTKTHEVWTSCCYRYETMVSATDDTERKVWETPHQREAKNRQYDPPKASTTCPFCGTPVIIKELGRTGNRDNLSRYRRAVVLRWYRGALWARAYDCGKHYSKSKGYRLTDEPEIHLVGVYRFKPGLAECALRYCGFWDTPFVSVVKQDKPLTKGKWKIGSPFHFNSDYGMGYSVIGLEEIRRSPFRYCMAEEAVNRTDRFLQYLTACCFYPRQIEMLMKAGMGDVVRDLVERGVKHAAVINWEAENPAEAFRLSRQDRKTFLGTSRDIRIPELHKRLKGRVPLTECADWIGQHPDIARTFGEAKKWNLPPEKLFRYLSGYVGCGRYGGLATLHTALKFWEDYVTAAEAMRYPLHRENILLPRELGAAHDEATARHRDQLEQQRLAEQREKDRKAAKAYAKRKAKLEEKYGFELDGYIIRVPSGVEEILTEGRKLQHCVGGYADRHMSGAVTILFMRKAEELDKPWLTIEMRGNSLVQIHGYRNEGIHTAKGRFAPDPREVYREFLDTWLDWLKKGSKRDESGNPKLPGKKGAAA